jgi:integrase
VGAFLERWLEDVVKPTKRERTYWGYRSIVERELVPAFGAVPLVSLSRRDVQAWVNRQTCAPMTTRHRLDCLRGALSRAVRWGLIDTNPAKEIDLPVVPRRTVRAMSPDDARALLAAVEGEWFAPLVTVALYTGLRQGELLGLRWEDVNLGLVRAGRNEGHGGQRGAPDRGGNGHGVPADDRGQGSEAAVDAVADVPLVDAVDRGGGASLTVHNALARLPGRHGIRYVLDAPKSARSRRTVPLAPPAVAAIKAQRLAQMGGAPNPHGLVFPRPDGRPIDGPALTLAFQQALQATDTANAETKDYRPIGHVRWHDLRHGFVSLMIASGVPLAIVSELAGHSGISITADIYGHLTNERKAEAMADMAATLAV